MKKKILFRCIVVLMVCVSANHINAQSFGMEQNQDGSYTFTWPSGSSITTSPGGVYNPASGQGSCFNCVQTLPPVTVYAYYNSSSNTYTPSSYYYQGQYYQTPQNSPPMYPPYYVPPVVIISTNPTPVNPQPPVNDPCKGQRQESSGIGVNNPSNANNPNYSGTVSSLTSTLGTDVNEKSAFFGVDVPTGQLQATMNPPGGPTGTGGQTIPSGMIPFGGMHTHPASAYSAPSAGDIYALPNAHASHASYNVNYIYAADGTRYALTITDATKAAAFVANNPMASNVDPATNSWMTTGNANDIFAEFNRVYNSIDPPPGGGPNADAAFERAQAYVLDKFDTGMTLLKADASGSYKEIHTVKTLDSSGNAVYSNYNCN
jgi:hypothetical protein